MHGLILKMEVVAAILGLGWCDTDDGGVDGNNGNVVVALVVVRAFRSKNVQLLRRSRI